MFNNTGKSFAGSFVLEGQYHTLSIFSMLGQMLAMKFGWMKGAKSARSFFIRPPLCNKIKLEYLKIEYTSIQTPDKIAYNGKPLSGRLAASNKQSSYFKLRLLTKNILFLGSVRSFSSRKNSSKRKVISANGKSCTNWSNFLAGIGPFSSIL